MPPIFPTPLSTQRYCWIRDFIEQHPNITSITDVGCGNGRMLQWTKPITHLSKINCIDSDRLLVDNTMDHYFRPNLFEMLFGREKTNTPLDINVFHGDIAVPDDRLRSDCFTLVEMIEHITLEHVEKVCRAIFGYYKPQYVIVTTPNIEFNPFLRVLAQTQNCDPDPNRPKNPENNFRHFDHKFEWNRFEFFQWAQRVGAKYGYEFTTDGVGHLPGSDPFGPCTQIAVFELKKSGGYLAAPEDNVACFDMLMSKLSVDDTGYEFDGDKTLKRICLMSAYTVPGRTASAPTLNHNYPSWDYDCDDTEEADVTATDSYGEESTSTQVDWNHIEMD